MKHRNYNSTIVSLGYLTNPEKTRTMLLYHNANMNDYSYGKYNGYSTHVQTNESSYEAFCRAVLEQTNLTVRQAQFRGSVHWPHFKDPYKSFFAQIFLCSDYEGIPLQFNNLGQNRWLTVTEVLRGDVPVWDGDKHFLPMVFDDNKMPFHGYMPYEKGVPRGWFFQRG